MTEILTPNRSQSGRDYHDPDEVDEADDDDDAPGQNRGLNLVALLRPEEKVTDDKAPAGKIAAPESEHPKEVKLDDGTYTRNDAGLVIATESPDGKLKRSFEYGDATDPKKVKSVTIDGNTYKYLGPITQNGKPVMQDGLEMASWSLYDDKNRFKENWYGARTVNENGVYTIHDYHKNVGQKEGADGKPISAEEAARRTNDGIWPSKVSVERADGSTFKAELKGKTVEKLTETLKEDGKSITRVWTRAGDKLVSDDKPARERRSVSIGADQSVSFTESDGSKVVQRKDASKDITRDGVTTQLDASLTRTGVSSADGSRSFKYTKNDAKEDILAEITTVSGDHKTTWTRKGTSDEWESSGKTETRKDLKVLPDGTLQFTNKDGVLTRDNLAATRSLFDKDERVTDVAFVSGATRHVEYDKLGVKEITDHIPTKGTATDISWKREGDGPGFVSERAAGQKFHRTDIKLNSEGDVLYTGQDNKPHTSRVKDIDRMARGEFVLSSESLMEARDRLSESVGKSSIDKERFNAWVKTFESNATKNKLDPEQVVKTMNALSDILTSAEKSPYYDQAQRERIVETAMHNLARPMEIDQGSHPTCNVTSVEVYAAVKHPDKYARLLKEVTLTGTWTTIDGKLVTPPKEALQAGKDEKSYDVGKPDSGKRNLASQLVQMTLINGMYETGNMNRKDKDQTGVRYVMGPNRTKTEQMGNTTVTTDLGEDLLIDKDKNPLKNAKGHPIDGPEMVQDDVLVSGKIFVGEEPPHIKCSGYADIPGEGRKYFNDLPDKERLLKLKDEGKMPILVPTMGGAHAQTLHDIWVDDKSGKVWLLLDNQHGEPEVKGSERKSGEGDGDGWVTLDQLHNTIKQNGQGSQFGLPVMPVIHKYSHPEKGVK